MKFSRQPIPVTFGGSCLPGGPYPFNVTRVEARLPTTEKLWMHVDLASEGSFGHDWLGRVFILNLVRPVTRWRKVRARLGLHERDTLRSGLFNKPTLVPRSTGPGSTLWCNGPKQVVRTAPGILPPALQ